MPVFGAPQANQTVPTGFSALPPPGPATPLVAMAKSAVNAAFETVLAEGVRYERAVFYSAFATEDQAEGMAAFIDKREPSFSNK